MPFNHSSNIDAEAPIIIVGAGLAGLTAAVALYAAGQPVRVLEARDRVGGRTLALPALANSSDAELVDVGATWGWAHHPYLSELLAELGIREFCAAKTVWIGA